MCLLPLPWRIVVLYLRLAAFRAFKFWILWLRSQSQESEELTDLSDFLAINAWKCPGGMRLLSQAAT